MLKKLGRESRRTRGMVATCRQELMSEGMKPAVRRSVPSSLRASGNELVPCRFQDSERKPAEVARPRVAAAQIAIASPSPRASTSRVIEIAGNGISGLWRLARAAGWVAVAVRECVPAMLRAFAFAANPFVVLVPATRQPAAILMTVATSD
jgi:hypothetical protein